MPFESWVEGNAGGGGGKSARGFRGYMFLQGLRTAATARNPLCSQATPTEDRALF